jgi:hypothetical protein
VFVALGVLPQQLPLVLRRLVVARLVSLDLLPLLLV